MIIIKTGYKRDYMYISDRKFIRVSILYISCISTLKNKILQYFKRRDKRLSRKEKDLIYHNAGGDKEVHLLYIL